MKRYKIHPRGQFIEDYQGQWVEWADHDKEIKRITEIYEKRIREIKEKTNQLLKVTSKSQEDREMKRYTLHERVVDKTATGSSYVIGQMFEDPAGEWVKYEDLKELLGKLGYEVSIIGIHDRLKKLEEKMDQPTWSLIHKSQLCNCEEKLNEFEKQILEHNEKFSKGLIRVPINPNEFIYTWICPKHGYKKR